MEKKLIAIYPILYMTHQYEVGDKLPTQDAEMVKAWLEAHTAEWKGGKEPMEMVGEIKTGQQEPTKATATPVTSVAGIEGQSRTGEDGDMVGRIPATPEREKQKVERKIPAKPAIKKK